MNKKIKNAFQNYTKWLVWIPHFCKPSASAITDDFSAAGVPCRRYSLPSAWYFGSPKWCCRSNSTCSPRFFLIFFFAKRSAPPVFYNPRPKLSFTLLIVFSAMTFALSAPSLRILSSSPDAITSLYFCWIGASASTTTSTYKQHFFTFLRNRLLCISIVHRHKF